MIILKRVLTIHAGIIFLCSLFFCNLSSAVGLLDALKDQSPEVRHYAIRMLDRSKSSDLKTQLALVEAMKDQRFDVRDAAATALGHLKPSHPKVQLALVEALRDENPRVRYHAAWILGEIIPSDFRVHIALVVALKDPSPIVHKAVVAALTAIQARFGAWYSPSQTTFNLLQLKQCRPNPKEVIHIKDKYFGFSSIITGNRNPIRIMYEAVAGKPVIPRLLYQSFSDGGWRVAPYIVLNKTNINSSYFGKFGYKTAVALHQLTFQNSDKNADQNLGFILVQNDGKLSEIRFHYTQQTKLDETLFRFLDDSLDNTVMQCSDQSAYEVLKYFDPNKYEDQNNEKFKALFSFEEESHFYDDKGYLSFFQKCRPGFCFDKTYRDQESIPNFDEYLDQVNAEISDMIYSGHSGPAGVDHKQPLHDFFPDFKTLPVRTYQTSHLLLSENDPSRTLRAGDKIKGNDVTVQVFESHLDGRLVEWHMAKDLSNRVWIDRIRFKDSKLTSFGTDAEIIDSGILTNKPLEYHFQALALPAKDKIPFNDVYDDITPFLSKLLPIHQFQLQVRGHR